MIEKVYEELAQTLDRIPNGFARTESGADLALLARLFDFEEARVASFMTLLPETPAAIGERASLAHDEAAELLAGMRRKGLIRARPGQEGPIYGLLPFVVGVYEEQLGRMDREMAELFERYMQETGGGSTADGGTSVHRVIPVEQAIPAELEIFPYERASQLLDRARSWGVRRCICRVQRGLIDKACDHTVENCLVFAPSEDAFDGTGETRPITREEAHEVLSQAADEGLIHSTMNQRDQIFYICNCCTCCCGVMRGVAEFGVPTAVAKSDFRVVVSGDRCTGCGACTRRCQFGALSKDGEVCVADYARCVGCGLCVPACPVEALNMERRPSGEIDRPPANLRAWMTVRATERGLTWNSGD
jgi:Pyruvate/2-oxoacid:ferredoxin oxidoreductase delta subunit